jgi:hypothetical protein
MDRPWMSYSKRAVAPMLNIIKRLLARYLENSEPDETFSPTDPVALRNSLQPGDVLLVEGNSRISAAIKYLTQSTWSHAALYVGPIPGAHAGNGEPHVLIEAELSEGVVSSPLSKYYSYHTRICRPVELNREDCERVCSYAIDRIGFDYDFRNIFDLMRYLIPLPIPRRWRRRMITAGSGNPTRIICSGLIAQAFEVIRYPILPNVAQLESRGTRKKMLQIRHSSLYAPRDYSRSHGHVLVAEPEYSVAPPSAVDCWRA